MCTMYRAYHDRDLDLLKEAPKNFITAMQLPSEPRLSDIACEGCLSPLTFSFCKTCDIRKCVLDKKIQLCIECVEYPCQKLDDFQEDWQLPILDHLREIQKIGLDEWLKNAEERWKCTKCGNRLHWYSYGICSKCE